jgi:hypothetical protein
MGRHGKNIKDINTKFSAPPHIPKQAVTYKVYSKTDGGT